MEGFRRMSSNYRRVSADDAVIYLMVCVGSRFRVYQGDTPIQFKTGPLQLLCDVSQF